MDTPGYHRPRTLLGKRLNDMVREALSEVDVVLFCLPADQRIGPGDQFIARELRGIKRPIIAVATKCDAVPREARHEAPAVHRKLGEWAAIVPVSSLEGKGIDHLREVLAETVPLSPPLYPEGDVTDESRDTLIAEFIREAPWKACATTSALPGRPGRGDHRTTSPRGRRPPAYARHSRERLRGA